MAGDYSVSGMACQPNQESEAKTLLLGVPTLSPMSTIDSRRVLWTNVAALMRERWGEENLNRLSRVAGIGPATCARMKLQETSVGIEVIDKVASAFQMDAWQLLVPGMDPNSLPTLMPVSETERQFYERMIQAARALKNTSN